MGPIEKIRLLEERISKVEASLAKAVQWINRQSAQRSTQPLQQDLPASTSNRDVGLIPSVSDDNKALAVLAWEALGEELHAAGKDATDITQGQWYEAIEKLDPDGRFPSNGGHLGATLRAILAERAGMHIRWGRKNVLRGAGERSAIKNGEVR